MVRPVRFFLAMAALAVGLSCAVAKAQPLSSRLRHGYVDDPYGQLHYAIVRPAAPAKTRPIVLLHQSPNSSAELEAVALALGKDRVAIALDTPGYGGSDGPSRPPAIEDYAAAIAQALIAMGYGPRNPIDLFGYHTGSKIAVELALTHPGMVRHLALSGIYDPPPADLAKALSVLHHPTSAYDAIERLANTLPQTKARYEKMGLTDAQWGKIRIDSLRSMTRQEFGHEAAFRYAPKFKARIGLVKQPVLLLPIDDGLAEDTRNAAPLFQHAQVTPGVFPGGVFFTDPEGLARALTNFDTERR